MTDAERIAEYLNRFSLHGWTASDVEQEARYNKGQKSGLLMAILFDVRREEREACLADIAAEEREQRREHPRAALERASERIVKRGGQ